jgi:hypothetical protein
MRLKNLFLTLLALLLCQNIVADKVRSTFCECSFGMSGERVKEILTKANLNPVSNSEGDLFIKNMQLDEGKFKLVCMMMSPVDGNFYKLIGTSSFETKDAADSCYNAVMARLRELYPNLQIVRRPANAQKLCTYPDDENVVTLGMYKKQDEEGKTVYYVNINYWNKYSSKQIREAQGQQ